MTPILETWYHQTDCGQCGEQICFLEDPHSGKKIPYESDGTDHRTVCPARQWQRHTGPPLEAGPPPKPKHKQLATEHEKRYEGQQDLSRWCK